MGFIEENLKEIGGRITDACSKYNRSIGEITILGVTKMQQPELIKEAYLAGIKHLGENKIQEAEQKIPVIGQGPVWHMIGHLQTNKVKKAVQLFEIIESVDSVKLGQAIADECGKHGKRMNILLEVNSSGEQSKYGIPPENVLNVAETINRFDNIRLGGLMTVGPLTDDSETVEKAFTLTRDLYYRLQDKFGDSIAVLSMGMSSDYETAIKYGSTELRIGTALFGARNY